MAIVTIDGVISGLKPPEEFIKTGAGTLAAGRFYSPFYVAGRPGAAAAPAPGIGGAALTSYAGQIPFLTAVGGQNQYLARLSNTSTTQGSLYLCDRLWHNSGINVTIATAQTINSVAWPARDRDGATSGNGVMIGVEVSTVTGAGTPTLTMGYTNQAGTAGQTATNRVTTIASAPVGTFYDLSNLAAGDSGVRSIQTFTLSATWTSGTIHLVAYRVLAKLDIVNGGTGLAVDAITSGFPRLYDNTVPFLLWLANGTTAPTLMGQLTYAQG